ncbi:unnamed protein product, partial [Prorocentrum cordatum]
GILRDPRSASPANGPGAGIGGRSRGSGKKPPWREEVSEEGGSPEEVVSLLSRALAATDDSSLKSTLHQQVVQLEREVEESKQQETLAVELLRRADGFLRDADHKHPQVIANVLRLRQSLFTAESKEADLAKQLAQAALGRKAAVATVTHAEGVGGAEAPAAAPAKEAEDIHERLLATEREMSAKETEARGGLARMEKHRKEIADRMAKNRKVNVDGGQ